MKIRHSITAFAAIAISGALLAGPASADDHVVATERDVSSSASIVNTGQEEIPATSARSVTEAQGYRSCPAGQRVRVSLSLVGAGTVKYYFKSGSRWAALGGTTGPYELGHSRDLGRQAATWRVTVTGGSIATIADSCIG